MKNPIISFLIILFLVLAIPFCVYSKRNDYYALTTVVVELDEAQDLVYVEDCNGNIWSFQGIEDWQLGDCAALVMDSRGSSKIFDDKIINTRYSSWNFSKSG